ncbi:MAG: hypothetical protein LBC75_08745 [Fibromonadaceae bacterium]|jgi:uncharacterized protein YgiM (DUF1202 family)|nr:hypothetical protein [Fibromonadaceae bacterium]
MINLLWIIILFIGLANAQPITYTYKYALETPVNIRSGQSSKHDIVGQLKMDERFEMDAACKSGWCRARAGNIEGWVHISQAKQAPTQAKTAEPAKAATNTEEDLEWWAIPLTILVLIIGLFVIWKLKWIIIKIIGGVFKIILYLMLGLFRDRPLPIISYASQEGANVVVYGEQNRYLFSKKGQLYSYTDTTVSIILKDNISTFDSNEVLLEQRRI